MKTSRKAGAGRVVRKVLADGTTKVYRYGPHKAPIAERFGPESIGALVAAFKASPEWRGLADKTRITYAVYLKDLERDAGAKVTDVKRRDVLALRDAIALARGNGAGTGFVRAASRLFSWAVDREWIEHSPAQGVKAIPGGSLQAWTMDQFNAALAGLSEPLRRAVVLALHTGQRRADLCRLMWSNFDGKTIRLKQAKTGVQLAIFADPALVAELAVWRKDTATVTILANPAALPWVPERLSEMLGRALDKIEGMPRNLNIHGLRKLQATRIADGGGSTHEIAAVTGHKTLGMIAHYTRSADQEKLASAAIHRLYPRSDKQQPAPKHSKKTGG